MGLLLLLRHAKAAWASPGMSDFDRPLDATGKLEAEAIGRQMRDRGFLPDLVLCSPAVRTRQTLEGLGRLAESARLLHSGRLYSGDAGDYLDEIRAAGEASAVLLVGHNPMMEDVAAALAGDGDGAARHALASGFPTGGLAVLHFDDPLAAIAPGKGRLDAFLRPQRR